MRQKIVVLVPDHGSLFEIAVPVGVWGSDWSSIGGPRVDLVTAGFGRATARAATTPLIIGGLEPFEDHLEDAHTVVIPTWPVRSAPVPERLCRQLRAAHARGTRIVGLCLGAFVVAEAGLVDGLSAVTHWRYEDRFRDRFPSVDYEPDRLYIDHGSVVTSAGSAAALDCCLHLLRRDHGAAAAAAVARSLVTAPHRRGGQSQFAAAPPLNTGDDAFGEALARAARDIGSVSSVRDLAEVASTSRRTLERTFRQRMGQSPRAWLVEQRTTSARILLEETGLAIADVATQVGFGSSSSLRREFRRTLATTPTAYRDAFRTR